MKKLDIELLSLSLDRGVTNQVILELVEKLNSLIDYMFDFEDCKNIIEPLELPKEEFACGCGCERTSIECKCTPIDCPHFHKRLNKSEPKEKTIDEMTTLEMCKLVLEKAKEAEPYLAKDLEKVLFGEPKEESLRDGETKIDTKTIVLKYLPFFTCNECGDQNIQKISNFCPGCGRKIIRTPN